MLVDFAGFKVTFRSVDILYNKESIIELGVSVGRKGFNPRVTFIPLVTQWLISASVSR